jgi:hypothetical protein
LRVLLAVGNIALLWHPMVFQGHYRLFDVGGAIGLVGIAVMLIALRQNTARLYREEELDEQRHAEFCTANALARPKFYPGRSWDWRSAGCAVVFRSLAHLDYRAATVLAVEIAVIHNFLWHQTLRGQIGRRCVHRTGCRGSSNSTRRTGCSIVGDLVLMQVMVGSLG